MWQTIAAGEVWHGEVCNRSKSGSLYWVNATIVPLFDKDGLPGQYISIRTDITARKRVEAQLSSSEERYRTLVDSLNEVVFRTDVSGRWIVLNPAWREITGFSVDDNLGRFCLDFVHPDDRETCASFSRRCCTANRNPPGRNSGLSPRMVRFDGLKRLRAASGMAPGPSSAPPERLLM